jgi:uncharacterized protein (DUF1501 family)
MKKSRSSFSRRQLFKRASCLALGSSSALATLSQLQMAHAQTGVGDDYKALVCVFLFGGNDAFNMLVPHEQSVYDTYSETRQNLAVPRENLLPITSASQAYSDFGLHPEMTEVQTLYNSGDLAFLANVGALVEPVTKAAYQSNSVAVPPQLFSHNDQQGYMQSLQSSASRNGWAGRAADLMSVVNSNPNLSMNISLSGSNLWQSGGSVIPYAVNPEAVRSLEHVSQSATDGRDIARTAVFEALLDQDYDNRFSRVYANRLGNAWSLADEVSAALEAQADLTTEFPAENRLATALQMTARLISARDTLGLKRQTFFIGMGDFDTHGAQLNRHPELLGQLSAALNAFNNATIELGLQDKVTTFTASDFGRTLTSNGDGTDHAWGSHQLIMGGAVQGGDIYGTMPSLAIDSDDDIGEGRIIPTTSMDQYGATLASWFGLDASNFGDVFPNLGNFDTVDLGFLSA